MSVPLDWPEIAVRLALAVLSGAFLGFDRTERGQTAGLRTTLLVSLAAAISMIQVNLLLATAGKTPESFAAFDPMRLPLGVLTGMGFIGAGAVVRSGGRVSGVTTAAALWLATTLGLCFGGGQYGLGVAGLALGMTVLWALIKVEARIPQERRGKLVATVSSGGPTDEDICVLLGAAGARPKTWGVVYAGRGEGGRRKVSCEVRWTGRPDDPPTPAFVGRLVDTPGVRAVRRSG